jgi:hypothetical protein
VPAVEVDEERTTLDDAEARKAAAEWEDGTTVEESTLAQGKSFPHPQPVQAPSFPQPGAAPNPFRAEGNTTNTTSTAGQTLDELTVEEHARPLPPLQLVPAASQPPSAASNGTLIVVTGTDAGKHFALVAGKPISVGRAVDNDVVLTDISVSRKHFELIYEVDRWILRDRGSGNGTLINDRMEDGSCQLHHGDRIEIGNTAFRFDHAASTMPAADVGWGQRDDDEARTIAGKAPSRAQDAASAPIARPVNTLPGRAMSPRAGTRPPPPTRARTNSGPVAPGGVTPGLQPQPPGTAPAMLASPNAVTVGSAPAYQQPVMLASPGAPTMAPFAAPQAPTPLGPTPLMAMPMPPGHAHGHVPASGHTPNPLRVGVSQPLMHEYPSASPADMVAVGRYSSGHLPRPSVPSMPAPMMAMPPPRTKARWIAIGAVGVLVASIGVAAAALGGSAAKQAPPQITAPALPKKLALAKPAPAPAPAKDSAAPAPVAAATKPGPTVQPIIEPDPAPKPAPPPPAPAPAPAPTAAAAPAPAPAPAAPDPAALAAAKAAEELAAKEKAAKEQAEKDAKVERDRLAALDKQQQADAAALRKQKDADALAARQAEKDAKAERDRLAADKRRRDKEEREREKAALVAANRDRDRDEDRDTGRGGGDVDVARAKANTQYESGDFRGAAATLSAAAKGAPSGDADSLRSRAADYRAIQDGITAGKTEATTKAIETLTKLKRALSLDKRVGGVHASTIQDLIANVAPRAAISHMTKSNFEQAFLATEDAMRFGAGGNPNVKSVRKSLEGKAGELYSAGSKAMPSDEGKAQLKRVLKIVPKDNVWYDKAQKALAKG